jgi:hypothetical protein
LRKKDKKVRKVKKDKKVRKVMFNDVNPQTEGEE